MQICVENVRNPGLKCGKSELKMWEIRVEKVGKSVENVGNPSTMKKCGKSEKSMCGRFESVVRQFDRVSSDFTEQSKGGLGQPI